jgi:trehalose 6-phosphate phosphatase
LERRDNAGVWTVDESSAAGMEIARRRLTDVADAFDGLLMEDKGRSLALHYRAAPQLESYVLDSIRSLGEELGDEYAIQLGKYVVELRPAGTDKGEAIRAFMHEEPFIGRTPVFIGDDVTDEHGFAVVNEMGGYSVKVGDGATIAPWRLPDVRAVEHWLLSISDD